MATPQCHGGFADIWKGQYNGQEVAAKALRVYLTSDIERIRKVGCPRFAVFINELTISCTEILQGGCDMEGALPSKCVTAVRRNNDRE